MSFDEIRQPDLQLITQEVPRRDGEDLVDFLECELFSLADEAENHEPGNEI